MSYSEAFTHNVLADLLHRQPIRDTDPAIAPARLRQALTTGPALDRGEARLLWASRMAREAYLEIREEIQFELAERCRQHGLTLSLQPVSAAFSPGQTHHLHAEDDSFQVDLIHIGDPDFPWIVQLQLGYTLREILGDWHRLQLRLLDTEGHEWLCQRYDGADVLAQDWITPENRPGEGPDQRMRRVGLSLIIE